MYEVSSMFHSVMVNLTPMCFVFMKNTKKTKTRKYDAFLSCDSDFICNFIAVRRFSYVEGNTPVVE